MITLSLIGEVMNLAGRLVDAVETIANNLDDLVQSHDESNKKLKSIDEHLVELIDRERVSV